MKRLLRLSYKLGKATSKIPKPTTKPFKELLKAFKVGREEAKPVVKQEPTTIVLD